MNKLLMMCALLGLPLLAAAEYGQGGGMGQGQGMGQGGGMQGGMGQGGMGGRQRPPGPPPEFLSACQGKSAGASATVNSPHGTLQGTCQLIFVPSQQGGMGQGQGNIGQGNMGPGQGGMGGGMGSGRQGGSRPQQ